MKRSAKPKVKAGTSRCGAVSRKEVFVEMFFTHNQNVTQAAIAAGYAPNSAAQTGWHLLKDPQIAAEIERRRRELAHTVALTAEEVIAALARTLRFDPGKMYNFDGTLKKVHEMPEEVRLELEGIDIDQVSKVVGRGKTKALLLIVTAKIKMPKKLAAIELAMRHFGLFQKDKPGYNADDESEPPPSIGVTIDFKDARRRKE